MGTYNGSEVMKIVVTQEVDQPVYSFTFTEEELKVIWSLMRHVSRTAGPIRDTIDTFKAAVLDGGYFKYSTNDCYLINGGGRTIDYLALEKKGCW